MIAALLLAVTASLLTASYVIASRRRRIPKLKVNLDEIADIETVLPQIAGLCGSALYENNEAVLYQNGHLLRALKESIKAARHTVHFETYLWARGNAETEFVTLLCDKAREGVSVRLLVDAVGALKASDKQMKKLRDHGVQVAYYNPIHRFSVRRFNNRSHRKLLIVDGILGFTFGHGVMDAWEETRDGEYWRDTGVRLRGSIVCQLQIIFAQDWTEATNTPILEQGCFLKGAPSGSVIAHTATSSTRDGDSSVALLYMLAFASARREIIIQNPYFAPDPNIVQLLRSVVGRGVVVRLMVPGHKTDSKVLRLAGQRLYGSLLQAGVRLFEYDRTFLHQKIVVVDGVWSHIGSTNFDSRSLVLNAEVGVGLYDPDIAGQLRQAFEHDLTHCHELTADKWETRPWYKRVLEWCAYQFHGQI